MDGAQPLVAAHRKREQHDDANEGGDRAGAMSASRAPGDTRGKDGKAGEKSDGPRLVHPQLPQVRGGRADLDEPDPRRSHDNRGDHEDGGGEGVGVGLACRVSLALAHLPLQPPDRDEQQRSDQQHAQHDMCDHVRVVEDGWAVECGEIGGVEGYEGHKPREENPSSSPHPLSACGRMSGRVHWNL